MSPSADNLPAKISAARRPPRRDGFSPVNCRPKETFLGRERFYNGETFYGGDILMWHRRDDRRLWTETVSSSELSASTVKAPTRDHRPTQSLSSAPRGRLSTHSASNFHDSFQRLYKTCYVQQLNLQSMTPKIYKIDFTCLYCSARMHQNYSYLMHRPT